MEPLWSWIVRGIFSFFTVLGNGGVILLITTRRRLHTTGNWFVLSLAVADFFLGVVLLPGKKLGEVYHHSKFFYILPKLFLSAASITNLCTMTLDRYIRIVHPLRYVTFMSTRRVGLLISAAWVIALLSPIFHLKMLKGTIPKSVGDALVTSHTVFYKIIPCIILLLATIVVLLIVRRQKKESRKVHTQLHFNYPPSRQHGKRSSKKTRSSQIRESVSAKVMVVVVAVFLFTLGIGVLLHVPGLKNYKSDIHNVFEIFLIMNSAANPFAYAFFKTDIKREMRLCCRALKTRR